VRTALRATGECPDAGRLPFDGNTGDSYTCATAWPAQAPEQAQFHREPVVNAARAAAP
jgi:hypothetical protein